jgi:hypothetical protein
MATALVIELRADHEATETLAVFTGPQARERAEAVKASLGHPRDLWGKREVLQQILQAQGIHGDYSSYFDEVAIVEVPWFES